MSWLWQNRNCGGDREEVGKNMEESGYELNHGDRIWNMHGTHGVTLDICLVELANKGYIPTWDTLMKAAKKDGTNVERLKKRICQISEDAYPKRVADVIKEKLMKMPL